MTYDKKDTGAGGNEQRVFMKDARVGWKAILVDPHRQLANGVTQYDYVETLGMKLGGQAWCVLDNFVDK